MIVLLRQIDERLGLLMDGQRPFGPDIATGKCRQSWIGVLSAPCLLRAGT